MPKVILPQLHKGQIIVLEQAKRFNYLAAGRRWRKTSIGVHVAVLNALDRKTVVWGAPIFAQVDQAWNECKKACNEIATFNETKKTIFFPTGGKIIFRSLDEPDNARGLSADVIIVDEAGDVKEQAWYEVLRPMLIDTGGIAWVMGTPKGRTWFWREHVNARLDSEAMSWQIPTVGCEVVTRGDIQYIERVPHELENPDIKFTEIQLLFAGNRNIGGMTERIFKQEILAQFIQDTGGVFKDVTALAKYNRQNPYRSDFVMGIDWADNVDYTVITVWDIRCEIMVDLVRFNQIGYREQTRRVVELNNKWKPIEILAELNSIGKPVIESLQYEDIPIKGFEMTSKSKPNLVRAYALNIEKKRLGLINDEQLIVEHQAYEGKRLPSGYVQYNAPQGMHDDIVVASMLGFCVMTGARDFDLDNQVAQELSYFTGR